MGAQLPVPLDSACNHVVLAQPAAGIRAYIRSVDSHSQGFTRGYWEATGLWPVVFIRFYHSPVEFRADRKLMSWDSGRRYSPARYRQKLLQELRCPPIGHSTAPFSQKIAQLRQSALDLHPAKGPQGARPAASAGAPEETATKHFNHAKDGSQPSSA